MKKVNWGVLGTAKIARQHIIPGIRKSKNSHLYAIASRNKNRSLEGKSVEVLVENRIQNQLKLFGRNKVNNSVIFLGDENNIGKIVKVKIESTNQNSLFGKIENNKDMKAA